VLPSGWTASRRKLVESSFLTRRCTSSISYIGKTVGLSYSDSAPFQPASTAGKTPLNFRASRTENSFVNDSGMGMRVGGGGGWERAAGCTLRRDGLFWTFREIYDSGMRKAAIAPRERAIPAI